MGHPMRDIYLRDVSNPASMVLNSKSRERERERKNEACKLGLLAYATLAHSETLRSGMFGTLDHRLRPVSVKILSEFNSY
jgi:hypothetical protein